MNSAIAECTRELDCSGAFPVEASIANVTRNLNVFERKQTTDSNTFYTHIAFYVIESHQNKHVTFLTARAIHARGGRPRAASIETSQVKWRRLIAKREYDRSIKHLKATD